MTSHPLLFFRRKASRAQTWNAQKGNSRTKSSEHLCHSRLRILSSHYAILGKPSFLVTTITAIVCRGGLAAINWFENDTQSNNSALET
mmetsp:Transcript_16280/g.24631  ORF Transcript_16280/g.24631 Transcript_16280/m.24631 type:complete len:88 (-) Transcript_16280:58-321(-)